MNSKSIISSVKNTYDSTASYFSASRNYIWPDLAPFLKDIPENSSVLDVGCGNGRLLLGLPQKIKYTGIDISQNLLKEAKKLHPNQARNFFQSDLSSQKSWKKLKNQKFDYIFCIAVLHHLPTHKEHLFILNQIKKHLKPQGHVLITAWNLWTKKFIKYHLDPKTKLKNIHWLYIPLKDQPRFHYAFFPQELFSLAQKANLGTKLAKSSHNIILSS